MPSRKTIVLHNHGKVSATFNLIPSNFCCVRPTKAFLAPSEKAFIAIGLKTRVEGTEKRDIIVKFDDDVEFKIRVECKAVASTISFEDTSITFEDTYLGLQRHISLNLEYHSVGLGFFKWKKYKNFEAEQERLAQLKSSFQMVKECETLKSTPLTRKKIITPVGHSLVYERIFEDEIEEIEAYEDFLYTSSNFSIIPSVLISSLFIFFPTIKISREVI